MNIEETKIRDAQIKELIKKQIQLDAQDKLLKMRELEIADLKILTSTYQKTNMALTEQVESLSKRLDDIMGRELYCMSVIAILEHRLSAIGG